MKKTIVVCCGFALAIAMAAVLEFPTSATSALDTAFDNRYGPELTTQFGCGLCHSQQSFSEFNPYGEDFLEALVGGGGGGGCLEFFPPNTHTTPLGRCEYLHAPGLFTPFSSGCTTCHGVNLTGLIAPSCFLCHGQRWTENGSSDAPLSVSPTQDPVGDALAQIEPLDSDGDGYSNIEEINALTHPGDPNLFPGGETKVTVIADKNWQRDWISSTDFLAVKLTPKEGEIDPNGYVLLKTDDGEIYSTFIKPVRKSVEAFFPKALLFRLFSSINASQANVAVSGKMDSGGKFVGKFRAKLKGQAPALLAGVRAQVKPNKWEPGDEIKFTLTGSDAAKIDTVRPIFALGVYRRAKLDNVQGTLSRATGELDSDDAGRVIGTPTKDVIYNVGIVGWSTDGKVLNTVAQVNVPVSDCYQHNPPLDHNVPFKMGNCTYLHAPGYLEPYANQCNYCHGADLRGTSVTPSCYLCHGQLWTASQAPQVSASRREGYR